MAELIAVAALRAVFSELLKLVVQLIKHTARFNTELTSLKRTLERIEPAFRELDKLSNLPVEDRTMLRDLLVEGKDLVAKCSRVKSWNAKEKSTYTTKLIDLDKDLFKIFQIEAIAAIMNRLNASSGGGRFSGSHSVPGLPELTVGLDQHLAKLKPMLLKDDAQVLVVSGPGGFGKTTLVNKLCHDDEVKGTHKATILFVVYIWGVRSIFESDSKNLNFESNSYNV